MDGIEEYIHSTTAIVQRQLKLYSKLKSVEDNIEDNKDMKIWNQTMYL